MSNPLWTKYGLSYRVGPLRSHNIAALNGFGKYIPETPAFKVDCDLYDNLVANVHDSIADYLEAHPEEQELWLLKTPGHMYFDIAEKVAKEWLDEACKILDKYGLLVHAERKS
jgi:hypothetical protein